MQWSSVWAMTAVVAVVALVTLFLSAPASEPGGKATGGGVVLAVVAMAVLALVVSYGFSVLAAAGS